MTVPTLTPPPPPKTPQEQILLRLDEIVKHMEHMDRRDRMRTTTGTISWVLHIIPTILMLLSLWFVYAQFTAFVHQLGAMTNTAEWSKSGSSFMENIRSYFAPKQ